MKEEQVILVNEKDEVLGVCDKLKAHQTGQLHRAISVFIFNEHKQMLLQRRADTKYHSGGLWTNTCCSHPKPGELTENAASRRLMEEMGIHAPLKFAFSFIYRAVLDKELIEHELDHVFIGTSAETPTPNPDEVSEYKYLGLDEIGNELTLYPERYTYWFKLIFERIRTKAKVM